MNQRSEAARQPESEAECVQLAFVGRAFVTVLVLSLAGCLSQNKSPLHSSLDDESLDRVAVETFPKGMPERAAWTMASLAAEAGGWPGISMVTSWSNGSSLYGSMERWTDDDISEASPSLNSIDINLYPSPVYRYFLGRAADEILRIEFEQGVVSKLKHQPNPYDGPWRTIEWDKVMP